MVSIPDLPLARGGVPCLLLAVSLAGLGAPAAGQAQTTFSIDNNSVSDGGNDCTGATTIESGDVLRTDRGDGKPALGPPAPVCIHTAGGTGAGTLGLTLPLVADVDAFSYGKDARLGPNPPEGSVWFSVTRSARGIALMPPFRPNVQTEALCGDAGASVFVDVGLPMLPASWMVGLGRHVQAIDGDGLASCSGYTTPGVGLVEPEPFGGPIEADDLDAVDVDEPGQRVYFSLDSAFGDPCSGVGGADSAAAEGFQPGDVLVSTLSGAAPAVWVDAASLGLDGAGAGTDDLDALAIWDNGNGTYDSANNLFSWLNGGADMVLFSVRQGSAVIGMMDNINGDPIEPGDVLVPPFPGGMSAFPGILIPAESLGLATIRSATSYFCDMVMVADDMDALDTTDVAQFDCNGNGREDALDIVFDPSLDTDQNGIPDGCEAKGKIRPAPSPSGFVERSVP